MKSTNRSTASTFTTSPSNLNVKDAAMNKAEIQDKNVEERVKPLKSFLSRRSFLGKSLAVGAGTMGAGLLATTLAAQVSDTNSRGGFTRGDADILRFLAAAELIEADLWQQYNELGGIQDPEVPGGTGSPAYNRRPASVGWGHEPVYPRQHR
jgi:hypothetical protein